MNIRLILSALFLTALLSGCGSGSGSSTPTDAEVPAGPPAGPPAGSTGPEIISTFPADGATGLFVGVTARLYFNQVLDPATVNASTFLLKGPSGESAAAVVSLDVARTQVTIDPADNLALSSRYTVEVVGGANGVKNATGASRDAGQVFAFTTGSTPPNASRALLSWADIEAKYAGSFIVPTMYESEENRFGYSSGIHAQLDNGNLLLSGHISYQRQLEVVLPTVLDGRAVTRAPGAAWSNVTDGLLPPGWGGVESYVLGGMLQIDHRLYFTKYQGYNGGGTDWASLGYRDPSAGAQGMWHVSGAGAHNQRVGGYMSQAPGSLVADGVTLLAGQQGTSGAATGRFGPNLFAISFNPATAVGGSMVARPLLYHDDTHTPAEWWVGDKVSAIQWIETPTHHAVLVLLYQKLGCTWYGEYDFSDVVPPNVPRCQKPAPYYAYKGYHAVGYSLQAWIYNPDELLQVYRGERTPWSVEPVEKAVLVERLPEANEDTYRGSIITTRGAKQELQMSMRNGRLIIMQRNGNAGQDEYMPKGFVFNF